MKNVPRICANFERDWRFFKGDAKGAHAPQFDDSQWRTLDLPHDWSIEGPFDEKDPSGRDGGYLPGGHGWYRKTFKLPADWTDKLVRIEFDGVYMNATVWVNGNKVGTHHYGYTSFYFDITPYLVFGNKKNVIAVHVDNSKRPNTRWYSGSGIYRRVRLIAANKIHIAPWGVGITTPTIKKSAATAKIETRIKNNSDTDVEVRLLTELFDPAGKRVAAAQSTGKIRAGASRLYEQQTLVKQPALWDVVSPNLYKATSRLYAGGKLVDELETIFGIRSAKFDPDRGFILNGKPLKLKGVDLHHDHGCLGAAVYARAEERKAALMKSIGANAVRTSHNPPSPEFIQACDRLGLVVMEEAFDEWEEGKLKFGYKDYFKNCWREDLTAMVMRDRNHPCIVLWSIGNEVPEQGKLKGARTAAKMARFVRRLDPSRPVGYGAHPGKWTPQLWESLDVCGYNYRPDLYEIDHKLYPKRCILGSETFPLRAFETWTAAESNKHIIGEFIWTGMDYLGESGIGHEKDAYSRFPVNAACCGEVDMCGNKKVRSYYRDILWKNGKSPHLFIAVREPLKQGEPFRRCAWGWPAAKASWTWPEAVRSWPAGSKGEELQVDVYSDCEEVELRLNGRLLGKNTVSKATRYTATWLVPYEPGTLEAISYIKGKKAATCVLRTADAPARLRLRPEHPGISADGCDLAFVAVEVLDKNGMLHPNADNEITFSISGPGKIVGLANGDQKSLEPFQGNRRKAFNGRCLVVIKSEQQAGKIKLTAQSKGLKPAQTAILSRPANHRLECVTI